MKKAEQWIEEIGLVCGSEDILQLRLKQIREYQADALRHAAELCRTHDVLSIMAAGWIEREAEQLESASAPNDQALPQPPGGNGGAESKA